MRAFIATFVTLLVAGCDPDLSTSRGGAGGNDPNGPGAGGGPGADGPGDPTQPGTCQEGQPHVSFANDNAVAGRPVGGIGMDRRRVKPYSAMKTEFQRALGNVPNALTGSAAAFGDDPPRWFSEPTAGAVSIYTTYTLAFTSCYDTMTDAKYGEMPTAASASTECAALQRKVWQRSPTPDETQACADHAVGLADEPVARRRWAHACAAVMSSAGFITY